jgi:periplasmic protein TonB
MPETSTSRRSRFRIWHGIAVSLLLHAAPAVLFVWLTLTAPPEEPPTLVVELQGAISDSQTEQKVQQETQGAAEQDKPEPVKQAAAPPADVSEEHPIDDPDATMPPPAPQQQMAQDQKPAADATSTGTGANTVTGAEQRQIAQTIQLDRPTELELLREYVKLLSKKVQAHLVYPDDGRQAGLQGTATVSFTILASGQIRPETLKIVTSSGQLRLDTAALKTIRASTPFDSPPRQITIAIAVDFGHKR